MSTTELAEEGMEMEETVGGRLAKTLDFVGVVCDVGFSDIPRPEPPDDSSNPASQHTSTKDMLMKVCDRMF